MMTPSANPKVVLQLTGITKQFGSLIANNHIDLILNQGEILAVLGENGAGKTTLIHILFGHYTPDEGAIEVFGRPLKLGSPQAALKAGIGIVHQHFTLADNLTVLDNIILGTEPIWSFRQHRRTALQRLRTLSQQFGLQVDPHARVGELSVGEQQRVEILKALYREARILILDEPTAVLTPQETDSLFATVRKLTQQGLSVVLISHKLPEVLQVSDRIVVLRSGQVVAERLATNSSRESLAELMVGQRVAKPIRHPFPPGDPVLELDSVSVAGHFGNFLLRQVSLTIRQHELIGIAGVSGNGQAVLADLLCGLVPSPQGSLRLYGQPMPVGSPIALVNQGVARIPEDRHATGLIQDLSIWENLLSDRYLQPELTWQGWIKHQAVHGQAQRLIAEYDVRCSHDRIPVQHLSGGNMQKVILARELSRQPRFILAHQPTRGLDVGATAYVHQELLKARARGAGILLISEDLDELLGLSDSIWVMNKGRLVRAGTSETISIRHLGMMMMGEFQPQETP